MQVVERTGEDVGLIATHLVPRLDDGDLSCRIIDLVVASRHRRAGIATALVAAAEAEARSRGASRLDLSSADGRADAHGFYSRLGFEAHSRGFVKRLG